MNAKMMHLGACSLFLLGSASVYAGAVVVGRDSPLGDMPADQVQRIFLGREHIVNDQTLVLVYQIDETNRTEFETKVLRKSGSELASYWDMMIFTGRAKPPLEVSGGDAAVRSKLASMPNAIGYVSDGGIDNTVKVIFKY